MAQEFKIDDAALAAYLAGELTTIQREMVEGWLTESVDHQEHFDAMKRTWEKAGNSAVQPVVVNSDLAWEKFKMKVEGQTKVINLPARRNYRWLAVAAGIILLIGISTIWLLPDSGVESLELTATNNVLTDELPDGTKISLNANSILTYPDSFDKERRVSLQGEGFFNVKRDEEKPFIVDLSHEAYVRVLGTSFNIRQEESEAVIEVYVASGLVEFGNEKEKVILEKGEIGRMDILTGSIEKIKDETPGYEELFWIDRSLIFEGIPLWQVVEILNRVYDQPVQLQCPQKENEPIRSSHFNETLPDVLNVLSEVHHLKISFQDSTGYLLQCND